MEMAGYLMTLRNTIPLAPIKKLLKDPESYDNGLYGCGSTIAFIDEFWGDKCPEELGF